jgi:O-antigen/teichoic acid export membrane protein
MLKAGIFIGTANITWALLSLLRSVIIARFISVEDFGIASTFALIMFLVEVMSQMSLDRLIIQAKDGCSAAFQSTAQAIEFVRGTLSATTILLIAYPVASLFHVPQAAWAYQMTAAIPFVYGLRHLDMSRFQRTMRFLPSLKVQLGAQLCSTFAAIPLAIYLGDYRAMLFPLLLQEIVFTVASHAVAIRPYRWSWNWKIVERAFSFGWPLLVNNLLMFSVFHGDRLIVGSLIDMTVLGWFSVAFNVSLMPANVASSTLSSFFLPQLSRVQDTQHEFYQLCVVTIQAGIFVGLVLVVLFSVFGPWLLLSLFGMKYEPALSVLIWVATAQAVRVAKYAPVTVALSKADTHVPMIGNIPRLLLLPLAAFLVYRGAGILAVAILGVLGEILGYAVSLMLVRRRLSVSLSNVYPALILGLAVLALVYTNAELRTPGYDTAQLHLAQVLLAVPLLAAWWLMPEFRQWTNLLLQRW